MSDSKNKDLLFKPLTDDDVDAERKKIARANPKELNDIYTKFAQTINLMLTMAQKTTDDEDDLVEIERLKRLINLVGVDERFIRCKDKIWNVRDHIKKRNADFFLNKDYSSAIKKDSKQVLIETLIEIIKGKFLEIKQQEREFYWQKAETMLDCVERYNQLLNR